MTIFVKDGKLFQSSGNLFHGIMQIARVNSLHCHLKEAKSTGKIKKKKKLSSKLIEHHTYTQNKTKQKLFFIEEQWQNERTTSSYGYRLRT